MSTLDLVGPDRWLLLTASPAWVGAGERSIAGRVPLSVVLVGRDIEDEDGRWEAVSGLGDVGAIVVRPDQHVAWRCRGPSDESDAVLRDALAELSGHPAGS